VSPRAVRWAVVVVCVGGIAGMIVSSIADNTNAAMTFGLITAAAATSLILVSAVTSPGPADDELLAAAVEDRVQALVEGGADEREVRALVGDAVALGRSHRGGGAR
jgi:hypothetical membrane protein